MYFWFTLFYFTLLLNNSIMEFQNFTFDHITLGHSGFLIFWKPHMTSIRNQLPKMLKFSTRIQNNKNGNFSESGKVVSLEEQFKIHSLKENTSYEVVIRQYNDSNEDIDSKEVEIEYPALLMKTNRKTNIKPAKPDFRWDYSNLSEYGFNVRTIHWLPCGKERNCQGNEAGTHFGVKIRSPSRRGEFRWVQHLSASVEIISIVFGIQYEAIVISINGDYEIESDPQELYFNASEKLSAITSVKAISFPNASILVSWNPPKYVPGKLSYIIVIANGDFVDNNLLPLLTKDMGPTKKEYFEFSNCKLTETRISEYLFDSQTYQLKPGETYTFVIVPTNPIEPGGLETRLKYTIPGGNELLLATSRSTLLYLHSSKSVFIDFAVLIVISSILVNLMSPF